MNFNKLIENSQEHFPKLNIKYKDESSFMKLLGFLLFFNKNFMTLYTTTIGSTIYFPSKKFVKENSLSSSLILLHELIHIYDANRYTSFIFSLLYLSPQILFLLTLPLMLISWKLIFLSLVFLLPLPSFFRMYFEKRAYFVSLYVLNYFIKNSFLRNTLEENKDFYLSNFKNANYYFMWIFKNLDNEFDLCVDKIKAGEKPYSDPVFNIIDDLLSKIEK